MGSRSTRTVLRLAAALAMLAVALEASAQGAPGVGECPDVPMQCLQSSAKMKMNVVGRTLAWTWKGRGVGITDVQNPATRTGYNLCIYDGNQTRVVATGVPAAGPWRARSWGFEYRDGGGLTGGITKIALKVGRRRDKLTVTGAGPYLPLPAQQPALPLTVQLVRVQPLSCWSSVVTTVR